MELEEHLNYCYGLENVVCAKLETPVNDVVAVSTETKRFALKIYNPASRQTSDVQWELDFLLHIAQCGAPVVRPVLGKTGYVAPFLLEGQTRSSVLFEWAPGAKPSPGRDTYLLLGEAAAKVHVAADSFRSESTRDSYSARILIDDQIHLMKHHLIEADRWRQAVELGERLTTRISDPKLDFGYCHMDLTLDNVHRAGQELVVFDFDSAGECWRALEPHGVLRASREHFRDWLEGYRTVRPFSKQDEAAVSAFSVIGDLRVVAWKLGVARSSRGRPLLASSELAAVVDDWLDVESLSNG